MTAPAPISCVLVTEHDGRRRGWTCCQCEAFNRAARVACLRCRHPPCGPAAGAAPVPKRGPARAVRCGTCGQPGHNAATCEEGTGTRRPPPLPQAVRTAAGELARALGAMGDRPQVRAVLAGLELALPEAAGEVRAALADAPGALGRLFGAMARGAVSEALQTDQAIARGIARALRGPKKARRR